MVGCQREYSVHQSCLSVNLNNQIDNEKLKKAQRPSKRREAATVYYGNVLCWRVSYNGHEAVKGQRSMTGTTLFMLCTMQTILQREFALKDWDKHFVATDFLKAQGCRVFNVCQYYCARNRYRLDVRPSVCHTLVLYQNGWTLLSCFLHHTIAHSFYTVPHKKHTKIVLVISSMKLNQFL